MPHLCLIFSQSDYLIQIFAIELHPWWQTVQIQISWLLQKPTDLDLHCLQNRVHPGSAGQGLRFCSSIIKCKNNEKKIKKKIRDQFWTIRCTNCKKALDPKYLCSTPNYSQNGPKSERPPFGQNGLINWLKRPHILKMKVKTAPSQNGPIFFL